MADQTRNSKDAPVKRDPSVAPEDMMMWILGRAYDTLNRVLELLYYLIRGTLHWFFLLRESPGRPGC